jgi:hypothetical protein
MDFTPMEELILCLALSERIDTLAERYRKAIASGSTWDQCCERTELERTIALQGRIDPATIAPDSFYSNERLIRRIEAGY